MNVLTFTTKINVELQKIKKVICYQTTFLIKKTKIILNRNGLGSLL